MPMDSVTRIAFYGAILSVVLNVLWFLGRFSINLGYWLQHELFSLLALVPHATLAYFFYSVLNRQMDSRETAVRDSGT